MGRTIEFVTLASVLAVGCASPQAAPEAPKEPPQARVARIFPQPNSLSATDVVVTIEVFNPRSTPLTLTEVEYSIDPGDLATKVTGTSEPKGTLEPGQGAEIEFSESIQFPTEPEAYLATLKRGTVPIKLMGVAKFSDGSTAKFERQGNVAAPSLPKLVINDAQAARYDGDKGIDVTLFLRLINENTFNVVVEELRYAVGLNGKELKTGKDVGIRLVANAVSEYEESAVVDQNEFGRAGVRSIIADGKVTYSVKGHVDVRGMEIPFSHQGDVKFGSNE